MSDIAMGLTEHLNDLRKTIIKSLIGWFIITLITYIGYKNEIFDFLITPINKLGFQLVILTPFEGFMVKLKASLIAGVVFSLPIILWEIWKFILPALHAHEKRYLLLIVPSSVMLFLFGIGFAYYTIFDIVLNFFLITAGEGFTPMIGASKYLSFLTSFLLPFGVIFQLPLVVMFLTRIGLITPKMLIEKRKYAIVIMFVLGAFLTPPDFISQTMMALPMILLYEISIIISRITKAQKISKEEERDVEFDDATN